MLTEKQIKEKNIPASAPGAASSSSAADRIVVPETPTKGDSKGKEKGAKKGKKTSKEGKEGKGKMEKIERKRKALRRLDICRTKTISYTNGFN